MPKKRKIKFFISYSHEDKRYKNELMKHLESLTKTHNIDVWHDGEMLAGQDLDKTVLKKLEGSDVILLLVSPSFMASWYCMEVELKKALERHNKGECVVIPVIILKTDIDDSVPFSKLVRVPEDGQPIQSFKPQNDGYVDAVKRIKITIDSTFKSAKKTNVKEPATPIAFSLYQNGKYEPYVLDDKTWEAIKTTRERMVSFDRIMTEKLIDFLLNYKKELPKAKRNANLIKFRKDHFKTFLLDICITTREWLFREAGARIHFRVLNKSKTHYIGYIVADGKGKKDIGYNWANKIKPISTTKGMIYYSSELDAPLIKSKNKSFHESGNHDDKYVDYITFALKLKDLCTMANPPMSMGISIENSHNREYAPYLVALTFLKFNVIIENYIVLLCTKIREIDKEFDITEIL